MADELPKKYKPKLLRQDEPPWKPERTEVMYACGYRYGVSYAMFAGPTPVLDDMLEIIPPEKDRGAPCILRYNVNGTDDVLYRWSFRNEYWRRTTEDGQIEWRKTDA